MRHTSRSRVNHWTTGLSTSYYGNRLHCPNMTLRMQSQYHVILLVALSQLVRNGMLFIEVWKAMLVWVSVHHRLSNVCLFSLNHIHSTQNISSHIASMLASSKYINPKFNVLQSCALATRGNHIYKSAVMNVNICGGGWPLSSNLC